jgi:hypothetical protein
MIVTGENRSTWRKTYPSANLSTTNATLTSRRSNSGARGERPAKTVLAMAQPMKNEINPNNTQKFSCDPTNGHTVTNRFALINTPRTWGTPSTKCRIFTHAAGSASAKDGARSASLKYIKWPTDPSLAAPYRQARCGGRQSSAGCLSPYKQRVPRFT